MILVVEIKRRKAEEMELLLAPDSSGHLIVSTLDAFVKWRAGEIKGILDRRLKDKEIKIVCLEEAESVDVEPAIAALANLPISSLVMVGDRLQRVENKSRKRKRDVRSGYGDELSSANNADSFRVARDGVDRDGEEDVHDHGSRDTLASSRPAPEGRGWYGWCANAKEVRLDRCKRFGPAVCDYVRNCFETGPDFTADTGVAPNTEFIHVFYDGDPWERNPLNPDTEEVGWHFTLFRTLCQLVVDDIEWYRDKHLYGGRVPGPGEPKKDLPKPTILIIMPLSRSAVPLAALLRDLLASLDVPEGVVQVSLPLSSRGESVPIVNCVRQRRFVDRADQYAGTQANMNQEYINVTRGIVITRMFVETQPFGTPRHFFYAQHTYADGGKGDARGAKYAKARADHLRKNINLWCCLEEWVDYRWPHRSFQLMFKKCFGWWPADYVVKNVSWWCEETYHALWRHQMANLPNLGRGIHDYKSFDEVLEEIVSRESLVGRFAFDDTQQLRSRGHDRTANRYNVPDVVRRARRPVEPFYWGPAISFGGLLLPCVTAEISPTEETGITRLCLPFIQADDDLEVEEAITSICAVAWVLGASTVFLRLLELDCVRKAALLECCSQGDSVAFPSPAAFASLWFRRVQPAA